MCEDKYNGRGIEKPTVDREYEELARRVDHNVDLMNWIHDKLHKSKRNISFGKFDKTFIINDIDNNICITFDSEFKFREWIEINL